MSNPVASTGSTDRSAIRPWWPSIAASATGTWITSAARPADSSRARNATARSRSAQALRKRPPSACTIAFSGAASGPAPISSTAGARPLACSQFHQRQASRSASGAARPSIISSSSAGQRCASVAAASWDQTSSARSSAWTSASGAAGAGARAAGAATFLPGASSPSACSPSTPRVQGSGGFAWISSAQADCSRELKAAPLGSRL